MKRFIRYLLSEKGYISSTRFVKLFITIVFVFDWIYARTVDKQFKYEPSQEIVLIIASILGVSLIQKYLEGR